MLGDDEPAFDDIVDSESLRPLLEQLPERERTVMPLRFYGNKTQTEIADRIGVSQMHVSGLLSRTLDELHHKLVA
ncbi:MAG: sigma-70 family RNA polymerase sigma factor [Acidothermales bacterium]|nr:sigma-70 family RNA polymerase sigma factor [Acidothermales bacterium]